MQTTTRLDSLTYPLCLLLHSSPDSSGHSDGSRGSSSPQLPPSNPALCFQSSDSLFDGRGRIDPKVFRGHSEKMGCKLRVHSTSGKARMLPSACIWPLKGKFKLFPCVVPFMNSVGHGSTGFSIHASGTRVDDRRKIDCPRGVQVRIRVKVLHILVRLRNIFVETKFRAPWNHVE